MQPFDCATVLRKRSHQGRLSGSVLVHWQGETLLDRGYGLADTASGRPNTPATAFQLASVSKQFTAAAILLLQEQRVLSVHDSVRAWVPDCPAAWEPITLHHLLTHTSGLGHWLDIPALSLFAPMPRARLLSLFEQCPRKFPPGEGWAYSSPAYVLLAFAVERAAGAPYAAFLQRAIFQPLGMASSGAGNQAPQPNRQALG
jgi:CubicO group peptidase (beta-lactamase class C family)